VVTFYTLHSSSIVTIGPSLAVFAVLWLVTDRQTDGQTELVWPNSALCTKVHQPPKKRQQDKQQQTWRLKPSYRWQPAWCLHSLSACSTSTLAACHTRQLLPMYSLSFTDVIHHLVADSDTDSDDFCAEADRHASETFIALLRSDSNAPFKFCSTGYFTWQYYHATFLPARRYASADNSDRNVSVRLSVRLSVCHAPVLCQNEES